MRQTPISFFVFFYMFSILYITYILFLQTMLFMHVITSYPLRMPLALSCWTGSHVTWISKADSAVALMLEGPTVGSLRSQSEIKSLRMCNKLSPLSYDIVQVYNDSHVHFTSASEKNLYGFVTMLLQCLSSQGSKGVIKRRMRNTQHRQAEGC